MVAVGVVISCGLYCSHWSHVDCASVGDVLTTRRCMKDELSITPKAMGACSHPTPPLQHG